VIYLRPSLAVTNRHYNLDSASIDLPGFAVVSAPEIFETLTSFIQTHSFVLITLILHYSASFGSDPLCHCFLPTPPSSQSPYIMKLTTLLVSLVTLSVVEYVSSRTPPIERDIADVEGLPAAGPHFPAREYLSNAERLRRGLPLNPPQRRSEWLVARAPQPSSAPGNTGQVFAVFGDTAQSGYFSSTLDAQGRYVVTQNAAEGVMITIQGHELVALVRSL
jgi:hypothetical protein